MRGRRWVGRTARELQRETGQEDPIDAIRSVARGLIDSAGLKEPPVDLPMLASFCKIVPEFQYCPMESAGRLVPLGPDLLRIDVNEDLSHGKQRFTIAHEITHTLLPTYRHEYIEDTDTGRFWFDGGSEIIGSEDEALCDAGAAELLMDGRWLRRFIGDKPMSLTALIQCSACFGASLHAMAWQSSKISLEPLAYVIWQLDYRKEERVQLNMSTLPGFDPPAKKLRVKRVYPSRTFPKDWYIPYNKSIPDSSPVGRVIQLPLQYTSAVYDFDLGGAGTFQMYSENISVPIRGEVRVISLLKPVGVQLPPKPSSGEFQSLELVADSQEL